jgi:hypothetical protein
MLDEIGKAVDPTWTGQEIDAKPFVERSDAELNTIAFKRFERDGETRSEDEIRADVRQRYQEETAPRRRRQAVVEKILRLLHRGTPDVIAFGTNGRLYDNVSNHVWAAVGAEEIFDTGGILLVQGGEVEFRRGLRKGDDNTAIVLVRAVDLKNVVERLEAGESFATLAPLSGGAETSIPETGQAYPYRTGFAGRPTSKHLILKELERRGNVGECAGSVAQEARDLLAWFTDAHPDAPKPTAGTIENQIREPYRKLRPTK